MKLTNPISCSTLTLARRFAVTSALALALGFSATAQVAQSNVVIPDGTALSPGNAANFFPWGNSGATLPGLRLMAVYGAVNFTNQNIQTPILVNRLKWRPNDVGAAVPGGTFTTATVRLSTSPTGWSGVTTNYATNHGADLTTVHTGPVVYTATPGTTGWTPQSWCVDILLTTPFLYDPSAGDLVIDVDYPGGANFVGSGVGSMDVQTTNSNASRIFASTQYPVANGTTYNHGPVVQVGYQPAVVINEFSYDDSGTDDVEFVELHNRSSVSIDISNWVLDSEDQLGPNTSYTIPPNTTLAAGGYYVLGSGLVPNVDQIVGTNNLWENDQESLTLRDSTGRKIDEVFYEVNKGLWPTAMPDGDAVWGNFIGVQRPNVYTAFLLGRNEVPAVRSSAYSRAVARFDPQTMMVSIVDPCPAPPIVCAFTAMHMHLGPAGVNGPVVVTLTKGPDNVWTGSAVLTPMQVTALTTGGMYLNAHTVANPGGEIRGQFTNFVATSLSRDDDGASVAAEGNHNTARSDRTSGRTHSHRLPASPGMPNDVDDREGPYASNYDTALPETYLPEFGATFADAYVIDPTVVSAHNPNAIPASPQGGNAAVFWDPTGGGNANLMRLAGDPAAQVFDAYVYFDAALELTGEHETWTIGFGSTGSPYDTPDPSGTLGLTANGNTGIGWTYQVTDTSATLYLIDHNDGGWGPTALTDATILAQIPIRAGVNDGWRRLRLEVDVEDRIVASLGNTKGRADGASVAACCNHNSTRSNRSSLYIAYRGSLSNNGSGRPPTIDDVDRHVSTSEITFFETASAHNFGTPTIDANSPPTIGNALFAIRGSGLVPSQFSFFVLGLLRQLPPLNLGSIGGRPGALVSVAPIIVLSLATDASGNASWNLPLPSDPSFLSAQLLWQILDPDVTLPFAVPLGTSRGMQTMIGH